MCEFINFEDECKYAESPQKLGSTGVDAGAVASVILPTEAPTRHAQSVQGLQVAEAGLSDLGKQPGAMATKAPRPTAPQTGEPQPPPHVPPTNGPIHRPEPHSATCSNSTPFGTATTKPNQFHHDLVITEPGIWAVSEAHARLRSRWHLMYNEVLEGSGVEIIRVSLDPMFPTEREIRCRTTKSMEDTKDALMASFKRKPGTIENVWNPEDFAEVVIHGVVVPGGYAVPSLGPKMKRILGKLNPGSIGPRDPTFLYAPMTKITTGTLRVCLKDNNIPRKLKIPTLNGTQEVECYPFIRNKRGGGGYAPEKEGFRNMNHENAKCQMERGDVPPYGECYICGDKSHWARQCPEGSGRPKGEKRRGRGGDRRRKREENPKEKKSEEET